MSSLCHVFPAVDFVNANVNVTISVINFDNVFFFFIYLLLEKDFNLSCLETKENQENTGNYMESYFTF